MIIPSSILEVNLNNLIHNYKVFNKITKTEIAATIKADAYGLGALKVFKKLKINGCKHFFVATVAEGIEIRKKFKSGLIYVLNGIENNKINIYNKNNLIPILNSIDEINIIRGKRVKFGIHIDTGINRLGIVNTKKINNLILNKNLVIVLSHLASPDETNNSYNIHQNNNFKIIKKSFKNNKIIFSLASSLGVILGKNFHYDLVRPGIALYGGHHNNIKLKKLIKPVVKLKAKILQIKTILKNEYIGYNQTFKTKKDLKVAIVGLGYGDGYPRNLSNKGYLYRGNEKYKVIGRVSMDSITIDISKSKKSFKIGDYIEVINYVYTVDKLAKQSGTISNEILTSITKRVKRVYNG